MTKRRAGDIKAIELLSTAILISFTLSDPGKRARFWYKGHFNSLADSKTFKFDFWVWLRHNEHQISEKINNYRHDLELYLMGNKIISFKIKEPWIEWGVRGKLPKLFVRGLSNL